VLARVSQHLAHPGVSIQNVRQEGLGEEASLIVRTHLATDASLAATIEDLRQSDAVRQVQGVMRVEGEYGP
jgi:homoserine dehydrogenase